ncbi:hypothetical protein [Leptolinea tardivitalis]|nr:hypothetical protein [Leptolinea tardivitalis]
MEHNKSQPPDISTAHLLFKGTQHFHPSGWRTLAYRQIKSRSVRIFLVDLNHIDNFANRR